MSPTQTPRYKMVELMVVVSSRLSNLDYYFYFFYSILKKEKEKKKKKKERDHKSTKKTAALVFYNLYFTPIGRTP